MSKTKRIIAVNGELLHVETPLGIVNIRTGLSDMHNRSVDSIEVIPNHYSGERKVVRRGHSNTRLVQLKKVNR